MSMVINRLRERDSQFEHLISNRTVLYDLEPVGISTAYVESLTSYIARLSAKHNVKLSSLLRNIIGPKIEINYLQKRLLQGSLISKYYLLNGIGKSSVEFSSTINTLTGRNDIQYLTMNSWTGIFSKNITSHNRRWCPDCLNQFKKNSKEIYEPLIWYISDIKKCDLHNTSLQEKCPNCGRVLPLMHSNLIMGHCQFCYVWLGDGEYDKYNESINGEEKLIIDNYKLLIEKAPKQTSFPTKNNISRMLEKTKEVLGFSSINQFSKYLGVNNPTLWTWINNQALPTPESLLQISRKIECPLYELIYEDEINLRVKIVNSNKKTKKKISKEEMEAYLRDAIISNGNKSLTEISREGGFRREASEKYFPHLSNIINEKYASYQKENLIQKQLKLEKALNNCLELKTPISLKECLKKCGVPPTTAQRYAPELCKKVTARYKEYKANQAKKRDEKISSELENIILDLHKKGIYPSINEINNIISTPGILIERKYNEIRKRVILSLGYK